MKRKNGKLIAEYGIGILVLIAVVLAALVGPDWYASWQDERQFEQVVLSNRETIRFLDAKSLDIVERIALLNGVDHLEWREHVQGYYEEYNIDITSDYRSNWIKEIQDKERRLVGQWIERGILPEQTAKLLETGANKELWIEEAELSVLADQSVLNVVVFMHSMYDDDPSVLIVIMDETQDLLYYAGVFGVPFWDWMAQSIGPYECDGYDKLWNAWADDVQQMEIRDWGDIAAVCGAQLCEAANAVQTDSDLLYQDFVLHYDRFDGFARKELAFCEETGFGMAVMVGTPEWETLLYQVSNGRVGPASQVQWMVEPFENGAVAGSILYRESEETEIGIYDEDAAIEKKENEDIIVE